MELQKQCQQLVGLLVGNSPAIEELDSQASDAKEENVLKQREDRTYCLWKEFTEFLRVLSLTAVKEKGDENKTASFDVLESLTTLRILEEKFSSSSSSSSAKYSKAYVESLLQKQNFFCEENLSVEEEIFDLHKKIQEERGILQVLEPATQEVAASLLQHSSKSGVYRDFMESTQQELRTEKVRWEVLRNVVQVLILESGLSFADDEQLFYIMELCGERDNDFPI
ncbi:CENP-H Fta3 [Schizosaccharomyces cryophilus OY26]|uniref:CENP-H Fta3 n=1 Tax=Schizosaccharomyces cryophilus (strain OY26 / ATCC MYA-4695 / CBS 11777 / NBRC 106824 / NRRL Y48691) TaxID=653667 RepID=S9X945_SCHCR|nr:CENP-H Fta3 [Schizosaccharomyces cryophilus OY26]EPY53722.1 CENP-H Fta3 [Schizosaccharomyces cryophilus OY26]